LNDNENQNQIKTINLGQFFEKETGKFQASKIEEYMKKCQKILNKILTVIQLTAGSTRMTELRMALHSSFSFSQGHFFLFIFSSLIHSDRALLFFFLGHLSSDI